MQKNEKSNSVIINKIKISELLEKDNQYIKNLFIDFNLEERDVKIYKYINIYDEGISFCIKDEKVDFIYLYNKNIMKFSQ